MISQFYCAFMQHKYDQAQKPGSQQKFMIMEYFPPELGYTVYLRDMTGQKGGGVIILVNSKSTSELKSDYHTNCENLWVQLNLAGSKSVLIGAYYKPHESDQAKFRRTDQIFDLSQPNKLNCLVARGL